MKLTVTVYQECDSGGRGHIGRNKHPARLGDRGSMTELRKTTNTTLTVDDLPDPAAGGGCHVYSVSTVGGPSQTIMFQHGPVKEAGVNGLQNEDLLAMVEHRLECFQRGPFASMLNEIALAHVRAALATLECRTARRGAAGVEGTNSPAATVEGR